MKLICESTVSMTNRDIILATRLRALVFVNSRDVSDYVR